ncbi:MAG: phytoene desaturase family protein, partial [Wenzhouxiangella sp.]
MRNKYDAVIVGGGHNGLVAACYLARAGRSVLILERQDQLGGASVSQRLFPDFDARISRYAYLVSLFPERIRRELGLDFRLIDRPVACYTPDGRGGGLLLGAGDASSDQRQIAALGPDEWHGYRTLMEKQRAFAELVWDSLLEPLRSRRAWQEIFRSAGHEQLWQDFVERPLGEVLETHLASDLLRGTVFTDGKIGSSAGAHDRSLLQNRTFLYHVIGNRSGQWRVPEGGMGRLVGQLAECARRAGVEWRLGAEVIGSQAASSGRIAVTFREKDRELEVEARDLLWNATPPDRRAPDPSGIDEGTSFKINMLLERLPQPADPRITPEQAFAGTFHIDEGYGQLAASRRDALAGQIPTTLPGEVYCHTLTDPSILSPELHDR